MGVRNKIKDNLLGEFECKHKDCKGVDIEFITKKDSDGKERKTSALQQQFHPQVRQDP